MLSRLMNPFSIPTDANVENRPTTRSRKSGALQDISNNLGRTGAVEADAAKPEKRRTTRSSFGGAASLAEAAAAAVENITGVASRQSRARGAANNPEKETTATMPVASQEIRPAENISQPERKRRSRENNEPIISFKQVQQQQPQLQESHSLPIVGATSAVATAQPTIPAATTRPNGKVRRSNSPAHEQPAAQKQRTGDTSEAPALASSSSTTAPSSSSLLPSSSAVDTSAVVPLVQSSSTSSSSATTAESVVEFRRPPTIRRSAYPVRKNGDPAQCLDIMDLMYDVYYEQEKLYTPSLYMSKQVDINQKMRSILVDWLVEVHHKFKLQPLTLWLCVNILDRYLEVSQNTLRSKLQLVGVTSFLIACKYEEIYPPEVKECVYITDYAYQREEILKTEFLILNALNYNIFVPTGYHFLNRYLNAIRAPERTRYLALYYAERNLQEYDMLKNAPHKFAAAALYAALQQPVSSVPKLRSVTMWNKTLEQETGFLESDLVGIARTIIQHVSEEPETASKRRLLAAKKKYSSESYLNVSSLPLPKIYSAMYEAESTP